MSRRRKSPDAALPETPEEWREAVDLASFMLWVHSAKLYGLVAGPEVNAERCERILELGRGRGVRPSAGSFERLASIFAGPVNRRGTGDSEEAG